MLSIPLILLHTGWLTSTVTEWDAGKGQGLKMSVSTDCLFMSEVKTLLSFECHDKFKSMIQPSHVNYLYLEYKVEAKGPHLVMQHLGRMPYSKLAAAEEAQCSIKRQSNVSSRSSDKC